jgi:hypothetical protein
MLTNLFFATRISRRRAGALAVWCAAGLAGACDDPLALKATTAVQMDTLVAFAMSGTPVSFPSAYNTGSGVVVRVDPLMLFDIAFDLQGASSVKLIPARLVSSTRLLSNGTVGATQRVGLQIVAGSFESVTKAPGGGFKYDSTVTVTPGQTVVLEVVSDACQFTLAQLLYSKVVVDSINASSRQVFFRATRDPNCGFKSFAPGVPKN